GRYTCGPPGSRECSPPGPPSWARRWRECSGPQSTGKSHFVRGSRQVPPEESLVQQGIFLIGDAQVVLVGEVLLQHGGRQSRQIAAGGALLRHQAQGHLGVVVGGKADEGS